MPLSDEEVSPMFCVSFEADPLYLYFIFPFMFWLLLHWPPCTHLCAAVLCPSGRRNWIQSCGLTQCCCWMRRMSAA